MKKTSYLLLSFALICMVNCTNRTEDYDTLAEQVKERKMLINEMAKDYGLDNFKLDDDRVRANLNMPIEAIEGEMLALSKLKGSYYMMSDGKGNYHIGQKVRTFRKRGARVEPCANDLVKADVSENYEQGDSISIKYSFHVEFDFISKHLDVVDGPFSATIKTTNAQTNQTDTHTFSGTTKVIPGQPNGFYPRYSLIVQVILKTDTGDFNYSFDTVVSFEDSGTQNTINYGVIQ